ncbi:MAG: gephyrin-like molybdotransferase Glp [Acidobacteriota bacterium]|nr:gephyrin-like molybdotransferase Glp [Acidobacteriota bacterium]
MIAPEEAWQQVAEHLAARPPETVARRAAIGRILAEPLEATIDVPANDVSAMDGYAIAGAVGAGTTLQVAGIVAAGDAPGATLDAAAALRIMTGAPIPTGSDRVIPVEETSEVDGRVTFAAEAEAGAFIRRQGEIVRKGARIFDRGALLTSGALALVATHGHAQLRIVGRPSVTVATTGNEVVSPEIEPGPGQLRDSHTDFLLSALASLGLAGSSLGIIPDDLGTLRDRVEQGLRSDVLILTGGVSMGEFDFVEAVLGELGCRPLFDAVAIQPGKPMVAAVHDEGWVFALPGNPASAMVCFWLLVAPALRTLMGHETGFWRDAVAAELVGPLPSARDRDRFLPAEVEVHNGRVLARPILPMGSHDLAGYACGSALVRITAGSGPTEVGGMCEVLWLPAYASPPA